MPRRGVTFPLEDSQPASWATRRRERDCVSVSACVSVCVSVCEGVYECVGI